MVTNTVTYKQGRKKGILATHPEWGLSLTHWATCLQEAGGRHESSKKHEWHEYILLQSSIQQKACRFLISSLVHGNFACVLSHVRLFATPWTVTHQASLSMDFSRVEYWSGSAFPSPGNLPDPETKARSPALQADSSLSKPPGKPTVLGFSISALTLPVCSSHCRQGAPVSNWVRTHPSSA